jgi:Ca2+-binding EF-hand superfamily protein
VIILTYFQDLETLFSLYDYDQSGQLDYKEFTSGIFGKPTPSRPATAKTDGLTPSRQ